MYLKKLSLINFKNIREENLEFRSGINCFVGDNGAGKTNVIDAVYFLSMCKSSLAMTDGQNMRHGSDFFLLDAPSVWGRFPFVLFPSFQDRLKRFFLPLQAS